MPDVIFDPRSNVETWEINTEGTVWVWTRDVRNPGQMQKTRVGGRAGGSRRLRISTDERRYNEEQIIDEMGTQNPFRNGALRLVSGKPSDDADVDPALHWSAEDYQEFLKVRDPEVFEEALRDIKSELIVRRLLDFAEKDGTLPQVEAIRNIIEERYKVGGTQRTVREMLAAGEGAGGQPLSG